MALNYGKKYFDKVVIYRPHNVYGPDMGSEHVLPQFSLKMSQLKHNAFTTEAIDFQIKGSGNETRSFIYIDDFIEGMGDFFERASVCFENSAWNVVHLLGCFIPVGPVCSGQDQIAEPRG